MKRIVTSIVTAGLLASVAVAEESGAFVGAQVGVSSVKMKIIDTSAANVDLNENETDVIFGLVAGYKQFFTNHFGLRYYVNFDYTKVTDDSGASVPLMNYGVNVDALYNFLTALNTDFGAFLGFGIGANTWSGSTMQEMRDFRGQYGKVRTTSFEAHLNVGLRGLFYKQHGLELLVKVPFTKTQFYDYSLQNYQYQASGKQSYSIALRYTFNF